jgi:hypothetical protein
MWKIIRSYLVKIYWHYVRVASVQFAPLTDLPITPPFLPACAATAAALMASLSVSNQV